MEHKFLHFYRLETYLVMQILVARASRPAMTAVELGVFTGSSACAVLPWVKANGGRMFLVDHFNGSPGTVVGGTFTEEVYQSWREQIMRQLADNLRAFEFVDSCVVHEGRSDEAAELFEEESVDYCMISADHRYTSVKRDIDAWWPKIRKGGVLCGHAFEKRVVRPSLEWDGVVESSEKDFTNGLHCGTIRAVTETFESFDNQADMWWVFKNGREANADMLLTLEGLDFAARFLRAN